MKVTDPEIQDLLWLDLDVLAFERGLKPVMKLEGSGGAEGLAAHEAEISKKYPQATQQIRRPAPLAGREWEIFVSFDPALARQAAELTDILEEETDQGRVRETTQEVGELLGYPRCCVQAYAEGPRLYWDKVEWLWLRRRLEAPEDLSGSVLHPLTTSHIPCRLDCPHSTELVSALIAGDRADAWKRLLTLPAFIFLNGFRDALVFRPLEAVSERWRYSLAAEHCEDPRLQYVAKGNVLEFEPGLLRILRDEQELGFFALDGYLWCPEKLLPFRNFWSQCLTPLEEPIGEERGDRARCDDWDAMAPRRRALRKGLLRLLDRLTGSPHSPLSGVRVVGVSERATNHDWGELIVTLRSRREHLRFRISPAGVASEAYMRSSNLVLSYDAATPPDSEEKVVILRVIFQAIDRLMSRMKEDSC